MIMYLVDKADALKKVMREAFIGWVQYGFEFNQDKSVVTSRFIDDQGQRYEVTITALRDAEVDYEKD